MLDQWAADADGGLGLLERFYSRETIKEPRLGACETEVLAIGLGNRWAKIAPRARYVIAAIRPPGQEPRRADGMVEIKGDTIGEYYLFRLKEDTGDRWYIQSVGEWNRQQTSGVVEPLTRERFEAAILSVLQ